MQLKTILNRVTCYKSFVFGKATWVENSESPPWKSKWNPVSTGYVSALAASECGARLRHDARAAAV